jgi:tetratricopeptide (TPR) repeat protein
LRAAEIAIGDYNVIIKRKGRRTGAALVGRGEAYARVGHHDKAVADYTASFSSADPSVDPARTHYLRAGAYRKLRQFDQALTDCQRAIDRDATQPDYYELRADIFADLGDGPAAQQNYTKALALAKGRAAESARISAKMNRGGMAPPPATPAQSAPNVKYLVEAAEPKLRLVGEYLLYRPIDRQAEIMTQVYLGSIPDYRHASYRRAAQQVNLRRLQDKFAEIVMEMCSDMELRTLVDIVRLEKAGKPADMAQRDGIVASPWGAEVMAREGAALHKLQKFFEQELEAACRLHGLGC